MEPDFNWPEAQRFSITKKIEIQDEIRDVINGRVDPMFKPCHPGEPKIYLNIVGKMLFNVVGNFECSCGIKYLIIEGNIDTSKWNFKKVNH